MSEGNRGNLGVARRANSIRGELEPVRNVEAEKVSFYFHFLVEAEICRQMVRLNVLLLCKGWDRFYIHVKAEKSRG